MWFPIACRSVFVCFLLCSWVSCWWFWLCGYGFELWGCGFGILWLCLCVGWVVAVRCVGFIAGSVMCLFTVCWR